MLFFSAVPLPALVAGILFSLHIVAFFWILSLVLCFHFFATCSGAPKKIPRYRISPDCVQMSFPSIHPSGSLLLPLLEPKRIPSVFSHEFFAPDPSS